MNIKKLFAILAGVSMVANVTLPGLALAATPDTELGKAYEWAYSKGITTMDSYERANMTANITRAEMAKMLANWAKDTGKTPDTSKACTFGDTASVKGDLSVAIVEACQLGLMGQGISNFRPYDTISRAEFGTALSRALWGDKYEGGTPYYANHLKALKAEGIMTQIDNAEGRKEVRGYVMLMLMRTEEGGVSVDCTEPTTALACLDPELDAYKNCPAACRADNEKEEDNTVVRSGDLAVKATAATEKKAILDGGVSDLDTITLKASEKITVNSITLERFGYSTASDIDAIWLEDGDGNKIADEKSLSSTKDTVTLKIKKEYREMDASNALTIVLRTAKFNAGTTYADGTKAGSTIGFKVVDVDSSAKNLDKSDYDPYTYDLVSYDGSKITLSVKGNDKTYNYEEGEYYEVSRVKVKAGASILALNGITLTNKTGKQTYTETKAAGDACPAAKAGYGAGVAATDGLSCKYTETAQTLGATVDLDEFVSNVKVTADGKEVKGLKYNVTKDNEIVLNWDTIEVEINKDVQIVVSIAMENLDEFGKIVRLVLDEDGDINATEKKTGARVTVAAPEASDNAWKVYTFNGAKVKFSNTKLSSTIDAAQGSEDVVIAKGKITVGEEVKVSELPFVVTSTPAGIIEAMKLTIAGESYDASVSADKTTFTFKNVFIEESGDFELSVDVIDDEKVNNVEISGKTVAVKYHGATDTTSIGKNVFAGDTNGRYENSREYVKEADVSGSISISQLKVQESKASLKNSNSKTVEFVKDETSDRTTVFKGTYTAKKSDITLKEFAIVGTPTAVASAGLDTTAEFYLYVDGEEVGMIDEGEIVPTATATAAGFDGYENFSDEVEVAAGKSVDVEVKAVISPDKAEATANINLDLYLRGEDKNGTAAGFAKAGLNTFKYVVNGSLTISDSTSMSKKTIALQDNEIIVAKFTLKPSKSDSVKLDNLIFNFTGLGANYDTKDEVDENITVTVDGTDIDIWEGNFNGTPYAFAANNVVYDATDVDDITEEVEVEVKVRGLVPAAKADGENYTIADAVNLTLKSVNGVEKNSTYTRLVLPALVKFDNQTSDGAVTKFRVSVEDYDGAQVQNLKLYTKTITAGEGEAGTVSNGATVEVSNQTTAEVVTKATFDISENAKTYHVTLLNSDFGDYFKTTDGTTLRVSKVD